MSLGARWVLPLLAVLSSGVAFGAGQRSPAPVPEPDAMSMAVPANAIASLPAASLSGRARTFEPAVPEAAPPTLPTQSFSAGAAPQSTAAALARMAALAGVIFAGQV